MSSEVAPPEVIFSVVIVVLSLLYALRKHIFTLRVTRRDAAGRVVKESWRETGVRLAREDAQRREEEMPTVRAPRRGYPVSIEAGSDGCSEAEDDGEAAEAAFVRVLLNEDVDVAAERVRAAFQAGGFAAKFHARTEADESADVDLLSVSLPSFPFARTMVVAEMDTGNEAVLIVSTQPWTRTKVAAVLHSAWMLRLAEMDGPDDERPVVFRVLSAYRAPEIVQYLLGDARGARFALDLTMARWAPHIMDTVEQRRRGGVPMARALREAYASRGPPALTKAQVADVAVLAISAARRTYGVEWDVRVVESMAAMEAVVRDEMARTGPAGLLPDIACEALACLAGEVARTFLNALPAWKSRWEEIDPDATVLEGAETERAQLRDDRDAVGRLAMRRPQFALRVRHRDPRTGERTDRTWAPFALLASHFRADGRLPLLLVQTLDALVHLRAEE